MRPVSEKPLTLGDCVVMAGGIAHAGPETTPADFRLVFFSTVSPSHDTNPYDGDTQYTRLSLLHHLAKMALDNGDEQLGHELMVTSVHSVLQYTDPAHEPWTMYSQSDPAAQKMYADFAALRVEKDQESSSGRWETAATAAARMFCKRYVSSLKAKKKKTQ